MSQNPARQREMTYSKSSNRERERTYSKSSNPERERERGSREGDVKDKGIVQDDSRAYTGIFEAYSTLYRVNFVLL